MVQSGLADLLRIGVLTGFVMKAGRGYAIDAAGSDGEEGRE